MGEPVRKKIAETGRPANRAASRTKMESLVELVAPGSWESPPQCGTLTMLVHTGPVSSQSVTSGKSLFRANVQSVSRRFKYFLTGDVKIDIEWGIHEQDRYESNRYPDLDNILKALLDTLCGPEGVLLDDCQIQEIGCRWIDSHVHDQYVRIEIRFLPGEFQKKKGFVFVHLANGLCTPFNTAAKPAVLLLLLDRLATMLTTRSELMKSGLDYYLARGVMSIQRVFHRGHLSRFSVREIDALRSDLKRRSGRR
jgi:Holliday junction resolvase RusA-like endonuclease